MEKLQQAVEQIVDMVMLALQGWPLWGKILALAAILTPIVILVLRLIGLYDATIGRWGRRRAERAQRAEQKEREAARDRKLSDIECSVHVLSQQVAEALARGSGQPVSTEAEARAAERIEAAVGHLARRSDEKSKRAFALLEKGDVSAAKQLFGEVLDERSRAGATANKEAADAARHIAAFTRLQNVAEASDLYARAAGLDPTNIANWIDLGDLSVLAGQLVRARDAFEAAIEQAKAAQDDWWTMAAYNRLGDVAVAEGKLVESLRLFELGKSIAARLVARDKANIVWQRDLSLSHRKMASVLWAQGNIRLALEHYETEITIVRRLSKTELGNAKLQRDLAGSLQKFADLLLEQGNLSEALKNYRAALAIAQDLTKADTANVEWQFNLSIMHNSLADALRAEGKLSDALENYKASLAIREGLTKLDPKNARWQYALGISLERIGHVRFQEHTFSEALRCYQARHEIISKLCKTDPTNAEWQRDLAVSCGRVASVLAMLEDGEGDALELLRVARSLLARLRELSPDDARLPKDLSAIDAMINGLEKELSANSLTSTA